MLKVKADGQEKKVTVVGSKGKIEMLKQQNRRY
jgi:hypothetical protein